MDRRLFLAAAASTLGAASLPAAASAKRTRWTVRGSEGFDLISFLGPLSGDPFYAAPYRDAVAEFAPRMPADAMAALKALMGQARSLKILLSPFLDVRFSAGADAAIADLLHTIDNADTVIRPRLVASSHAESASDANWGRFKEILPVLRSIVVAMRDAGFAEFRAKIFEPKAALRMPALRARLEAIDIVAEVERYTGKPRDAAVEVILLEFCKPHGIRVLGQRFLSAIDWDDQIVIRTAGHELLHPPIDMAGAAAQAALGVLRRDALLQRIVAEHDPSFGYNSLDGLFDEDLASAVDQIIAERTGSARDPAERWNKVDGGMHVLSAGLYGLMKRSGFARTGGDLEGWLARMVRRGALGPASLQAAAAPVLKRPADKLWPLA